MVGTIQANLTMVDNADDTTNWTSSHTMTAQSDSYIEGAAAVGLTKVSEALAYARFNYYAEFGSYLNVAANPTHIYFWANVGNAGGLGVMANGGIRLYIEDTGGITAEWNVAGKDTYGGGWTCFVAYTDRTPDVTTGGTVTKNAIQYVGIKFDMLAKTTANVANVWFDAVRRGAGLIAYGGSAVTPMDWDDIISGDNAGAYGVISRNAGVYVLQGPIAFGTGDGTNSCYFEDSSKLVTFKVAPVSTGHYCFEISGHTSTTTSVVFGSKVAGQGTAGCVFSSATGTLPYNLYFNGAGVNNIGLYGCTFIQASGSYLSGYSSGAIEALNCSWQQSYEVVPKDTLVRYCSFVNSDDRALRMIPTGHNITGNTFINCPTGIHISGAEGTYEITIDENKFYGCNTDLESSIINGEITGNLVNDANASSFFHSAGGTGVLINAKTIYVKVQDASTVAISGARVRMSNVSDGAEIFNDYTSSDGEITVPYNYGGSPVNVKINIRKSQTGETKYFPVTTYGTIGDDGLSLTYVMTEDSIA